MLGSGEAAEIVLAVVAEHLGGREMFTQGELLGPWKALGLRADDLFQGLVALARGGHIHASGEGDAASLHVSLALREALGAGRHRFADLPPALHALLAQAAQRQAENRADSRERRDGFG